VRDIHDRGHWAQKRPSRQVAKAELLEPALVGFSAGGNDILGFRCDVAALARSLHEVAFGRRLRRAKAALSHDRSRASTSTD
jgi:hypothetical protein